MRVHLRLDTRDLLLQDQDLPARLVDVALHLADLRGERVQLGLQRRLLLLRLRDAPQQVVQPRLRGVQLRLGVGVDGPAAAEQQQRTESRDQCGRAPSSGTRNPGPSISGK
jgi:hypothetical protein